MFRNKIIFIVLSFLSIVMLHIPVGATNITIPGYHEIFFSGTTTEVVGAIDFPVVGSSSSYTPSVGDTISIHFGATYYCCPDEIFQPTWNHDYPFDIFTITVNDGTDGYVLDVPYASDWNGYDSSFRDDFWVRYIASYTKVDGQYSADGCIFFNHETQSGFFSMFTYISDLSWHADLTSSLIVTEPVPEPATLLLLGAGLVGLTRIRKRTR